MVFCGIDNVIECKLEKYCICHPQNCFLLCHVYGLNKMSAVQEVPLGSYLSRRNEQLSCGLRTGGQKEVDNAKAAKHIPRSAPLCNALPCALSLEQESERRLILSAAPSSIAAL